MSGRIYITGPCIKGQTTACVAEVEGDPHPVFGPKLCGWPANGPHPDPVKGYLVPLCQMHLDDARAEVASGNA